jgi:ParB family chromosome partitioning protein
VGVGVAVDSRETDHGASTPEDAAGPSTTEAPKPAADQTAASDDAHAEEVRGDDTGQVDRGHDLAPVDAVDEDDLVPVPGARFAELPVEAITPNPRQPRTVFDEDDMAELVHSVREIGVLQPVVVRPTRSESDGPVRYELVMGERRWRASQQAGLATVPAIVRETGDDALLRDALLENLHRAQLNPLEEAAAYGQLLEDFGCTHEVLATRIGRSRPQISNTLRLLRLPPLVQRRVAAGVLSAGHARALLGLDDAAAIERLAQRVVAEGLSVRAVEEIVALGGDAEPVRRPRAPRAGARSAQLDELAQRLSDRFDTRVQIALGRRKGRLSVEFASVDDLNRILELLAPGDAALLGRDGVPQDEDPQEVA